MWACTKNIPGLLRLLCHRNLCTLYFPLKLKLVSNQLRQKSPAASKKRAVWITKIFDIELICFIQRVILKFPDCHNTAARKCEQKYFHMCREQFFTWVTQISSLSDHLHPPPPIESTYIPRNCSELDWKITNSAWNDWWGNRNTSKW